MCQHHDKCLWELERLASKCFPNSIKQQQQRRLRRIKSRLMIITSNVLSLAFKLRHALNILIQSIEIYTAVSEWSATLSCLLWPLTAGSFWEAVHFSQSTWPLSQSLCSWYIHHGISGASDQALRKWWKSKCHLLSQRTSSNRTWNNEMIWKALSKAWIVQYKEGHFLSDRRSGLWSCCFI